MTFPVFKTQNILLFCGGAALILLGVFVYRSRVARAEIGTLHVYEGAVDVRRHDAYAAKQTGEPVHLGETVRTATASRVAIILKDGTEVRLDAGSEVAVGHIRYKGRALEEATFDLFTGKIWSHVAPLADGGHFDVETPTIVASVRGTVFAVSRTSGESNVRVYARSVFVRLRGGVEAKEVRTGEQLRVRDTAPEEDIAQGPSPYVQDDADNWTRFNRAEDAKLGTTVPTQPSTEPTTSPSASSVTVSPTAASPTALPAPLPPTAPHPSAESPAPSTSPPATVSPKPKPIGALVAMPFTLKLQVGETAPVQVMANYNDGTSVDVTGRVAWQQSPVLGEIVAPGVYRAHSGGTGTLQATLAGVKSNKIQVTIAATHTLESLQVQCAASPSQSSSAQTTAQRSFLVYQCNATAVYADGVNADVTTASVWAVISGTAKGSFPQPGVYQAGAFTGSDTVQATYQGVSGTAVITLPG